MRSYPCTHPARTRTSPPELHPSRATAVQHKRIHGIVGQHPWYEHNQCIAVDPRPWPRPRCPNHRFSLLLHACVCWMAGARAWRELGADVAAWLSMGGGPARWSCKGFRGLLLRWLAHAGCSAKFPRPCRAWGGEHQGNRRVDEEPTTICRRRTSCLWLHDGRAEAE